MDGSGPPNGVPGVPLSGDDPRSGSADTNSSTTYRPTWSESGGGVSPELVLVDPDLAPAQRLTKQRKAAMSSTEPANSFPEPAQPAAAPAARENAQPSMRDVPLGTLIFRAGLLGEEQLEDALQEGMRTGKRLGEVLLERGWLNEGDLGRMLAGQKGLPFVDVSLADVEADALEALGEEDARRQAALPLFYEGGKLVVAVGDPSNELVLEGLRRELETEFELVVAPYGQLRLVIEEAYASPAPAPDPDPDSAPAPGPFEGVLFPELLPRVRPESADEGEPEPVLDLTPASEPEPELQAELEPEPAAAIEIDSDSEQELQPAPTLLSRMLFPSVRHAAQEAGAAAVETADEPEPEPATEVETLAAEAPAEEPEAEAPAEEPEPEAPAPAAEAPAEEPQSEAEAPTPVEEPEPEAGATVEEDLSELAVADVPEMPAPSFEQPAPEPEPAAPEPVAEAQAEEVAEPEPEPEAERAEAPKHAVVVRLRDGETLRIGELASADEASALARDAVGQISSAAGNGTWPLFAGRYLSPDTIVSVDLVEESPDA